MLKPTKHTILKKYGVLFILSEIDSTITVVLKMID